MYGIPGFDPSKHGSGRPRPIQSGFSFLVWCKILAFIAGFLVACFFVLFGIQSIFIDTMRQAFPR